VVAAIAGLTAVGFGAFGAHGLRGRVAPEQVASWQTAAHYQLVHAAVLLALALYGAGGRPLGPAPWLFAAGMALFSGSIYALVLGGPRWLRLHRLVYAAAAAAVVHFLWLVKADLREPLLYAGVLAALLGARLLPERGAS